MEDVWSFLGCLSHSTGGAFCLHFVPRVVVRVMFSSTWEMLREKPLPLLDTMSCLKGFAVWSLSTNLCGQPGSRKFYWTLTFPTS